MGPKVLFIILYSLGLIFFFISFAYEWIKFGQTGDKKYSFLTYYPYELNQFKRSNSKSYFPVILSFFASGCLICASLFFVIANIKINPTSSIIFLVVSALSAICFNVLRFIKLTFYKGHLLTAVIYMCLNLFLVVLYYLFFTNESFGYVFVRSKRIILMVVLLALAFFEFYLMVNHTYKDWYRLVKVEGGVYSRPKHCYLAILEWGNFLIYILSFIPLFIVLFA